MTLNIGQRIDGRYGELSPQEQRAADFILDHMSDLAVYNASELARLSGVSKATVSRLFRRLGFQDSAEVRDHARALRSLGAPLGGPGASAGTPAHPPAPRRGWRRTPRPSKTTCGGCCSPSRTAGWMRRRGWCGRPRTW
jgi:hypothetical protein